MIAPKVGVRCCECGRPFFVPVEEWKAIRDLHERCGCPPELLCRDCILALDEAGIEETGYEGEL